MDERKIHLLDHDGGTWCERTGKTTSEPAECTCKACKEAHRRISCQAFMDMGLTSAEYKDPWATKEAS